MSGAGRWRRWTAGVGAALLAVVAPELALLAAGFALLRARVAGEDGQRGDTVQWVIIVTVGALMAVTVGGLIYSKVTAKAAQINLNTPSGP